jgi:hypothetical protein
MYELSSTLHECKHSKAGEYSYPEVLTTLGSKKVNHIRIQIKVYRHIRKKGEDKTSSFARQKNQYATQLISSKNFLTNNLDM